MIIVVLYMFSLLFERVINVIIVIVIVIYICIVIVRVINDVYVFIVIVRVINIYFLEMPLQHDAFERRTSARAAVRNQLKRTRHSLEFRPEELVGLVSLKTRFPIPSFPRRYLQDNDLQRGAIVKDINSRRCEESTRER